jgi:hypothetical protein
MKSTTERMAMADSAATTVAHRPIGPTCRGRGGARPGEPQCLPARRATREPAAGLVSSSSSSSSVARRSATPHTSLAPLLHAPQRRQPARQPAPQLPNAPDTQSPAAADLAANQAPCAPTRAPIRRASSARQHPQPPSRPAPSSRRHPPGRQSGRSASGR